MDLEPSLNHSNQNPVNVDTISNNSVPTNSNSDQKSQKLPNTTSAPLIIRPPPINLSSTHWRSAAPKIYQLPNINPEFIVAKSSNDGNIQVKTKDREHFCAIQKALHELKINFKTFHFPTDRSLKVIIRGIPTDVSEEEIQSELSSLNYQVKLVKRFGSATKPMQICLVIMSMDENAKNIFDTTSLFFVKVSVEAFRRVGPAQCFACQRFGHGTVNCEHALRCVKCAGAHKASDCPKTREQPPLCCNCGGEHTANFRGCPYYQHSLTIEANKSIEAKKASPQTKPIAIVSQTPITNNNSMNYAKAAGGSQTSCPVNGQQINNTQIIKLLMDLLSALTTDEDPKTIMITTIKSFLSLLNNCNE
jgi:hypothetical protein